MFAIHFVSKLLYFALDYLSRLNHACTCTIILSMAVINIIISLTLSSIHVCHLGLGNRCGAYACCCGDIYSSLCCKRCKKKEKSVEIGGPLVGNN